MRRTLLVGIAAAAMAAGVFGVSVSRSGEKPVPPDNASVALFPGPGIPKGWVVRAWDDVAKPGPEGAVWRVDDEGVLHGSDPRGTWLVSERDYADFELTFEFKLPDQGNGGCGLRFPPRGDPAFDGLELQMLDLRYHGDNAGNVGADERTGGLYKAIPPRSDAFKPGGWNRYVVRCEGPRVRVTLNDVAVVDANLDEHAGRPERGEPLKLRPRRGRIGFQELSRGGGHVMIRNARIRVLGAG